MRLGNDFPHPFAEHAANGIGTVGCLRPTHAGLEACENDARAHAAFPILSEKFLSVPKDTSLALRQVRCRPAPHALRGNKRSNDLAETSGGEIRRLFLELGERGARIGASNEGIIVENGIVSYFV
jgi:hypothetical protein